MVTATVLISADLSKVQTYLFYVSSSLVFDLTHLPNKIVIIVTLYSLTVSAFKCICT